MSCIGIGHRTGYLRAGGPRHNNVRHKRWAYLRAHPRRQRSTDPKDATPLSRESSTKLGALGHLGHWLSP